MRRALISALLVAAIVAAWVAHARSGVKRRPNVVVIVMDTTRGDRCSFTGYARPTTPRLDEFAKDAVVFQEAWSPSCWTGPAHASLFTGLRLERHGFYAGNRFFLGGEHETLARRLEAAGYATGCFANNAWFAPEYGLTRGFEKIVPLHERPQRAYPWATETHSLAADWAESVAREGKPFFLFVNDMEPHLTYAPPPEVEGAFLRGSPSASDVAEARVFDFPRTVAYSARGEELRPSFVNLLSDLYDAEIAALDREIGALLDRLRAKGLLDSTIVVVAGDHGEMLGEHHMLSHGFSLHRAARHVPLLVRFPGAFDGGRREKAVVRLEDVFPTILELCGLQVPGGLDGASLTRDLEGRVSRALQGADLETKARIESLIAGIDAAPLTVGSDAIFDGRWHFLAYADGRSELYDISRDPGETEDLSDREPGEVERLTRLLRGGR
jgi:arylsulfatase A-like enzyme